MDTETVRVKVDRGSLVRIVIESPINRSISFDRIIPAFDGWLVLTEDIPT